MSEIKHVAPVQVNGEFDEEGMWHTYETPEFNLFSEALGSDGLVHTVRVRASFEAVDQLLDKVREMMARILENRMRDMGVWE